MIGTLLGSVKDGDVVVSSCFPVPHSETEEQVCPVVHPLCLGVLSADTPHPPVFSLSNRQVFVNMEFHSSMVELHRRVNPKEVIVGWYATGNAITQHSVLIHEFYGRETDVPVHMTINTDLTAPDMAIRAYVSSALGIPANPTGTVFTPVNVEVSYVEAERVGGVCGGQRVVW